MSSYNHHAMRAVVSEQTPLFPRLFRCVHSDQVWETVKNARIDCRRAINSIKQTADLTLLQALRKQLNGIYEAALDVQLTEFDRYVGQPSINILEAGDDTRPD